MNTKHTPGPWLYDDAGPHGQSIYVHGCAIAQVAHDNASGFHFGIEAAQANARLIAAAPELLEAAEWIARAATMRGPFGTPALLVSKERMDALRSAIAKARGGEV